ncbi:hypothetical protein LJ739_11545 [Aestuariibacter halophilus]|uniref:Lipoprotein n=1 Tax=Fluctibacter halophilus TaxID=226011 RepID=A0ABS8G8H0_9ALTE|nr:hypothetical protein [Aestuariibacter halophilus]MCC2616877.1 hypothetical protein [Aestuariibacter halophilus]
MPGTVQRGLWVALLTMLSGCAINGYGVGFSRQTHTSDYGSIERIEGFGVLLDTRSPTRSLVIGHIERFLLCPSKAVALDSISTDSLFNLPAVQSTDSEFSLALCQDAAAFQRARSGLSMDFSPTLFRLLIGHQQQSVVHIQKDTHSVFRLQYLSGEAAQGQALLFLTEEPSP